MLPPSTGGARGRLQPCARRWFRYRTWRGGCQDVVGRSCRRHITFCTPHHQILQPPMWQICRPARSATLEHRQANDVLNNRLSNYNAAGLMQCVYIYIALFERVKMACRFHGTSPRRHRPQGKNGAGMPCYDLIHCLSVRLISPRCGASRNPGGRVSAASSASGRAGVSITDTMCHLMSGLLGYRPAGEGILGSALCSGGSLLG